MILKLLLKLSKLKGVSIPALSFICLLNANSQSLDTAFKSFYSGRFEKAAYEFEQLLPLIEKAYGSNDTAYYAFYLNCAALSYENSNQYAKAEEHYLSLKGIYEQRSAVLCAGYVNAINRLAGLYTARGNFVDAEPLYIQALEINKKLSGEKSRNYFNGLNNIAQFYQRMGRFDKAETFYLQSIRVARNCFGERSPEYVIILNNISALYQKSGKPGNAEAGYLRALEIITDLFGENHPETVSVFNNLGAFNDDTGNYQQAEYYYVKALNIRKDLLGTEHPDYAVSANNLAQLYSKTGRYEKAEVLYLLALKINRKTFGEEHFNVAIALNNLGALYQNTGRYEQAESMFLESLKIRKKVLGEKHPDFATALNNTALFYNEIGNFGKAEPLYLQAEEVRREAMGENDPGYAVILNNMALFYSGLGMNEKAEALLQRSIDINKHVFGEEHPNYSVSLSNMALFCSNKGKYDKAEQFLLQAMKINKKVSGEMNLDYSTALNNLAGINQARGDYRKAEQNFRQAVTIIRKICGVNHPNYASTLNNLALLYMETGNNRKADQLYQQALETYLFQIRQQFSFLSETEKEKYLARVLIFFSGYQNFILKQYHTNKDVSGKAYDMELSGKGLLLNADKQLRISVMNGSDSLTTSTYNLWMAIRASLAKQYSLPLAQQKPDIKAMEAKAEELEKELTRLCMAKEKPGGLRNIQWRDVQRELNPGEAAVEFTHFRYYNGRRWTDSIMYAAIVLKKDDVQPAFVPLFEGKQLDTVLFKAKIFSETNYVNDLYRWSPKDDPRGYGKGRQLYGLIWEPLEKHLAGVSKVYFSTSGRLHQLSFAAIPCGDNELLSERHSLHQLTSTGQLTVQDQEGQMKKILLFGGMDYNADFEKTHSITPQLNRQEENIGVLASPSPRGEDHRGSSFIYLDGTLDEVRKISAIAGTKGINSEVLTGNKAIEESFKNLSGSSGPEVIHIATHGFFFPYMKIDGTNTGLGTKTAGNTQPFRFSDNPLMRSGLAFSGANHAWRGEDIPSDLDDGILTAYEVSNMSIPNTRLVVLSACETGLGEIKGSEGVYGLQRAFKMAGAEYILMSLWQIPDYQTSELMNHFYDEWFSGKPIGESLETARKFMKSKYPFQPFMWAAFVLVK